MTDDPIALIEIPCLLISSGTLGTLEEFVARPGLISG